jgi:MGT family glycosyltransferase
MDQSRVAIFSQQGNGHVYPVLPLCRELVARGHAVSFVCIDHYAKQISETGAEPVLFKCKLPDRSLSEEIQRTLPLKFDDPEYWRAMRLLQRYQFEVAEDLLSQLLEFYRCNPPDLILYDPFMVGGRLFGKHLARRTVRVSPYFAQFERYIARDNGTFTDPIGATEYRKDLDSFLLVHGITTNENLWYVENLNIHLIPREFQYCNNHFDDRFCFVGALLDRPFVPKWKNNSSGAPVVLISDLSGLRGVWTNADRYYRLLIEALSDAPCHCILSVGNDIDSRQLGPLPANFEINRLASHLEILPQASLMICHGGMLSTLEALYNGVPVLTIPLTPGTKEVAYRTAELGLGRQIYQDQISADSLGVLARQLITDKAMHAAVRKMSEVFRKSGGVKLATERIEAALGEI